MLSAFSAKLLGTVNRRLFANGSSAGSSHDGSSRAPSQLYFHADYVRGRCGKTSVEIDKDGTITVDTVNRGEAATRWIAKLMGKKTIGVLDGGDTTAPEASKEPS